MAAIGIGVFRETGEVHSSGSTKDRQAFPEPICQHPCELCGQYNDYGDGQRREGNRQGINQRFCGNSLELRDAQNENRNSTTRIDKRVDQMIGILL